MKILIYGSGGWIGGLFVDYLKSTGHFGLEIYHGLNRVDSIYLEEEIVKVKPTHVISFIGRTHGTLDNGEQVNTIDYLEYPGKLVENIRDNLYSPIILADLCIKYGIHYTYLGTGCIFNSNEYYSTFDEYSLPNYSGSSYSIVKGFTDRLMHTRSVLNLRIRMPISSKPNPRNFITKIVNYSKICSLPNSMTVLDDFFPIFFNLMVNKKTGTYNCTNPGTITHDEILHEYKLKVDSTIFWENMTLEEQSKILKSERSNNHLDTSLIEKEYPKLSGIKESIKKILIEYSLNKNIQE